MIQLHLIKRRGPINVLKDAEVFFPRKPRAREHVHVVSKWRVHVEASAWIGAIKHLNSEILRRHIVNLASRLIVDTIEPRNLGSKLNAKRLLRARDIVDV